jgi:hypothetical protein
METFARSRTWRVAVFACLLVGAGMTTDVQASTLPSPRPAILVRKSAEPFGLFAYASSDDALRQKWLRLKQRFDDDMVQLALCDGDRDGCVSPPALRLLSIVDRARGRGGRARLGETNRAINLAIRATLHNMVRRMSGQLRSQRLRVVPATARTTPLRNWLHCASKVFPQKIFDS